ncbi:MAG: hypothetical protein LQ351_000236 [Letrouitia transgressa]|nr:MAG: hypothetical protein LQ351_000236 [Letrouitia transgressa]
MPVLNQSQSERQARRASSNPLQVTSDKSPGSEGSITPTPSRRGAAPVPTPEPVSNDSNYVCRRCKVPTPGPLSKDSNYLCQGCLARVGVGAYQGPSKHPRLEGNITPTTKRRVAVPVPIPEPIPNACRKCLARGAVVAVHHGPSMADITPPTRQGGGAPVFTPQQTVCDLDCSCPRCLCSKCLADENIDFLLYPYRKGKTNIPLFPKSEGNITLDQPKASVPVSALEPAIIDPNSRYHRRLQQTFPPPSQFLPHQVAGSLQEERQPAPESVSSRSNSDSTVRPITTPAIRVTTPGTAQSIRRFPILDPSASAQAPPTARTADPPSRLDGAEEEGYTAPSSTRKKTDEFCKSLRKIPSKLSLLWRPRPKSNDNNEPPVAPESGPSGPKRRYPSWSLSSKRFKRGSRNQRTPLLPDHGGQDTNNYGSFVQSNSSSQQTTDPFTDPSSNSEQRPPPLPPRRPITPQPANPSDASSRLETFGIHPQDPVTQEELEESERQAAVQESQQTLRAARIQNLGIPTQRTMI